MRIRVSRLAALAAWMLPALAPNGASAQPSRAVAPAVALSSDSRLWLEGSSNVNRWSCRAEGLAEAVHVGRRSEVWEITGLPELLQRAELGVPVGALRCGNRVMEKDLRRAIRSDLHPRMTFRLYTYHLLSPATAPEFTVRAVGALSLAGRENVVQVDARVERLESGRFRVRGSKALRMTDFGIDPPTAMLGLIRAHDEVVVRFDLVVDPRSLDAGAPAALPRDRPAVRP